MDKRIETLKSLGCDTEDAMTRFLDDEDFYLECFDSVIRDAKFEELKEHIEAGEVSQAFECAHTLKGLIANTGLSSLSSIMVEIVESLRGGSLEGLSERCEELFQEREKYLEI